MALAERTDERGPLVSIWGRTAALEARQVTCQLRAAAMSRIGSVPGAGFASTILRKRRLTAAIPSRHLACGWEWKHQVQNLRVSLSRLHLHLGRRELPDSQLASLCGKAKVPNRITILLMPFPCLAFISTRNRAYSYFLITLVPLVVSMMGGMLHVGSPHGRRRRVSDGP
jgi:hypothetical protein